MLLRSVCFSTAGCNMLILQSPWIPILQEHGHDLVQTLRKKNIKIRIFCGSDDEDCMPMAQQLYTVTKQAGIDVEFSVQENSRHQFPTEMYTLKELGFKEGNQCQTFLERV